MKISIITVALNAESVIRTALASVAEQDYPTIEQIVIDGGSTDGTMEIVETFKTSRFKIRSEPDDGIYSAMNRGIGIASGEGILFLNADDRLAHPTTISDLTRVLIEQNDVALVFGDVLVRTKYQDIYRSHRHVRSTNIGFEPLCHQAIMARKTLFDRVGTFDTQYRICADYDWLLRCVDANTVIAHVPRVVCWYATGGESDKFIERQMEERAHIISLRRNSMQRWTQRLASAWRRNILTR